MKIAIDIDNTVFTNNSIIYKLLNSVQHLGDKSDTTLEFSKISPKPIPTKGVLKKIFPYLVPETYLTDEEIEEALSATRELFDHRSMLGEEEENESVSITRDIHSKFDFSIYSYRSYGSEYAKITLYPGADRNLYY